MPSLTRRQFLGALGSTAATIAFSDWLRAAPNGAKPAGQKPNIIFILSDDVGLDDVHVTGGAYHTPHIDALAQSGTLFQYCYATPLCGPSRCELLTGRYPFRTGMTSNNTGAAVKPANETMLPKVLKRAGYVTASVGKWAQLPLQPADFGFDEYWRFQGSGVYWRNDNNQAQVNPRQAARRAARGLGGRNTYTVNGQTHPIPENVYVPDMMHDFLVDFITRHKDEPFYVHYPMSHVHSKIVRTPDSAPNSTDLYADNIAYMDKLVGKLMDALDKLNLRENTLVIFTGDNGTALGAANRGTVNGQRISGQKATMLEGGSRVPLIANWKGTTPVGQCHDLIDFSDFFPTLATLAGAPLPAGIPIDGHSFAPQVKGQKGQPREWIYMELEGRRYVATKQWKLNNSGQLFNMSQAPFKETLIAADSTDPQAIAARRHLQEALDNLVGKNAPAPPTPLTTAAPKKNKKLQRQNRRARRLGAQAAPAANAAQD